MRQLAKDILEAIDALAEQANAVRERLLHFYKGWPADRPLGPPFQLGLGANPSEFTALRDRLAGVDGPARLLQQVIRAESAFDQLLDDYQAQLYASSAVGEWRQVVEDLYDGLAQATQESEEGIEAWASQMEAMEGPDSSVLEGKDYIFPADFVKMWKGEITLDAARARISSGRYGTPIRMGKYKVLEKNDMRETLLRRARSEAGTDGGHEAQDLLKRLPRKRRSKRKESDPPRA